MLDGEARSGPRRTLAAAAPTSAPPPDDRQSVISAQASRLLDDLLDGLLADRRRDL
jgi:hypothetical protein